LRVNLQRLRGGMTAAMRVLPDRVPTLAELGLPDGLAELVAAPSGLVLVCGPTGCGKSTTMAALVGEVNRRDFRHVVTIEDPIEYEHENRTAVIEQVEVGRDAPTFATALRSALRRDPDVLLVGEMRDLETMATVVTAAETGHLILSTLHTADVTQAVHRVIDAFPVGQQTQVRYQLALSLRAVVCQQLVPRRDGRGRLPALEVLVATWPVRNHIRRGQLERVPNEMLTGRALGMRTMEDSLAALVADGAVDLDEARARSLRPDELERRLNSGRG
jgi:twitching motility protein PilT